MPIFLQLHLHPSPKPLVFTKGDCYFVRSSMSRLDYDQYRLSSKVHLRLADCAYFFYYFRTRSHNDELSKEITELKKSYTELKLLKESLESRETTIQENLTDTQKEAQLLKVCT